MAAMWWAAMTVTTVGYGDIYPITPLGQTIPSMITIGAALLLALPSAILAAGFMEERQKEQRFHEHAVTETGISLLERVVTLKVRGLGSLKRNLRNMKSLYCHEYVTRKKGIIKNKGIFTIRQTMRHTIC